MAIFPIRRDSHPADRGQSHRLGTCMPRRSNSRTGSQAAHRRADRIDGEPMQVLAVRTSLIPHLLSEEIRMRSMRFCESHVYSDRST